MSRRLIWHQSKILYHDYWQIFRLTGLLAATMDARLQAAVLSTVLDNAFTLESTESWLLYQATLLFNCSW